MLGEQLALGLPGRFELVRHLGSGGMGAVYEAFDRERGARVAIKTLRSTHPDALLQLKNEFRTLADLRHEHLVHLLELVEDRGRFFVVMELVEGTSFVAHCRPGWVEPSHAGLSETRLVRREGTSEASPGATPASGGLDEARLRAALSALAAALCVLHDSGKVHRDVKPSNVLVTPEGRVVLVDFGLAHDLAVVPVHAAGTRAFMAPEQAAGQALTSAADWFSVGVMLYLALSGRLPFQGAELQRKMLAGAVPALDSADCPRDVADLARDLLHPDPALRPNGRAVLARLGQAGRAAPALAAAPFVGRNAELTLLSAGFERAELGAVVALVVGDSGLGKSALVREWLARVSESERELLILRGRCYERELVPYKAFDGIIDALSQRLERLSPDEVRALLPADAWLVARVFPVFGRVTALEVHEDDRLADPQELRTRAFAALRELFARIAERTRLVLFVDDLQWADTDSHRLLGELLRAPAPRLYFVATARPPETDNDPLATLCERLGDVVRVTLAPLSHGESLALAQRLLGTGLGALADAVACETGGHPLFLQALAGHVRHEGGFERGAVRLDDAIRAHVERAEPEVRRLLELVALSGAPLPSELLRSAAGLDPSGYATALAALRVRSLVRTSVTGGREPVEPYHDYIRESIVARLDEDCRREHHARLATALESAPEDTVDPQSLVRHLEGAGRAQAAAERAELGARRAENALAFDQAAELYRVALRLAGEGHHQALTLGLAEALTNAGRAKEAALAYLDLIERATPEQRITYRRRAADHLLRSGHLEQGLAVLADTLSELGERLPSQRRALLITLWQRLRLWRRGKAWQPTPTAAIAPESLRRIDAYHAVGVSLALIDPVRGAAFEARAVELALDAGDPLRLAPVLLMEAGYESTGGGRGFRSADAYLGEVERIRELTRDAYVNAALPMLQGFVAYHAGDWGRAVTLLGEMESVFPRLPGCYFEQVFCHCFRLICLRNQGRIGELQRGFATWVNEAERRGDRFTEASLRLNLNGVWLARDDPDEALRDLARVTWIPPRGGYHIQHWYEQQAKNEIDLYTGRSREGLERMRHEMRALARSFLLRLRLHRALAHWQLGRLLLANVQAGHAARSALREVKGLGAKLRADNVGFARVWAALLDGGAARLAGRPEIAARALESALADAKRHAIFHCEHAAAYQLAKLERAESGALRQRALAWAETQEIRAPARYFAALIPGFGA